MIKKIMCTILIILLFVEMTACGKKDAQHARSEEGKQETVKKQSAQKEQGGEGEARIFIEPIEGISEEFIRGMDVSNVIMPDESDHACYYEQGEQEELFRVLADAGVNYIRVQVWNDCYDKNGKNSGSNVEEIAKIGAKAAQNGLKLLVDFHYSDLRADFEKQFVPKKWKTMDLEEKQQAVYDFTKESIQTILDAGADVGIVQIGNEINNGLAGEKEWECITPLLAQCSSAVRETAQKNGRQMQVAVHIAEAEDHDQAVFCAQTLADAQLDYDILGVSYYPYWHGTMQNMTTVLKDIHNSFEKETLVLETAYCYTLEKEDRFKNRIKKEELIDGYAASVQSQALCIRDVMEAAVQASALGVFYWQGKWDNQALFDAQGHPLDSLNVFKYLEHGASCKPEVDYVKEANVEVNLGDTLQMPETVEAVYNDRSLNCLVPVIWDKRQTDDIRTDKAGTYTVKGRLEDGIPAVCHVTAAKKNWLLNAGFEKNDTSMWKISYQGENNPTNIKEKEADAKSGKHSFQFWSEEKQNFKIEQTVSGLKKGTYKISACIRGADVGPAAKIYLYAVTEEKIIRSKPVKLSDRAAWEKPVIKRLKLDGKTDLTIGMKVKCAGGGWGMIDDFVLVNADKEQ